MVVPGHHWWVGITRAGTTGLAGRPNVLGLRPGQRRRWWEDEEESWVVVECCRADRQLAPRSQSSHHTPCHPWRQPLLSLTAAAPRGASARKQSADRVYISCLVAAGSVPTGRNLPRTMAPALKRGPRLLSEEESGAAPRSGARCCPHLGRHRCAPFLPGAHTAAPTPPLVQECSFAISQPRTACTACAALSASSALHTKCVCGTRGKVMVCRR